MKDIDYISTTILKRISEIDEFKGKWTKLKDLAPDRLNVLKKIATIASIGSSTRIDGSKLSDIEVELILSQIEKKAFQNRDEEEVGGYAEAMNLVFDAHKNISITENYIKQLHSILLSYSAKDQRRKGEYKKIENNVEAFDDTGKSIGIIFKTTTPFDTPFKISELINWYNLTATKNNQHPLLIIAIFIVHFLAIHPFQDGNGRLSRIITMLMLLQADYAYAPYCSLESIIEENKEQYYRALRTAQETLDTNNSKLEVWLDFFVKTLKKQAEILELRIEKESLKSLASLSRLSETILKIAQEQGRVTVSDVLKIETVHRNTIKKHIRALVHENHLAINGTGKGTFYTKTR